jgi:AraC family transcriptional regulator, melibiose operon regulatory protein
MELNSLFQSELRSGEYLPCVTSYYFKQWEHFMMDIHIHNRSEIMYALSGKCLVEANGTRIPLKKGELILLDANIPHRLLVHDSCRMLNVEFEFAAKAAGLFPIKDLIRDNEELDAFLTRPVSHLVLKDDGEVFPTLKSLVFELDRRNGEGGTMAYLLLTRLLLQLARLASEVEGESGNPAQSYVRKAIDFIHSQYDRKLQLNDIASAVNLHPNYLHRLFKASRSCTIMDYLTTYRIGKARMLLAHSDIPVTDIPDYIGMNSRQYFSAVFKKTPAKPRRITEGPSARRNGRKVKILYLLSGKWSRS